MINRTIARPKTNSLRGAMVMPKPVAPIFMRYSVAWLNTSSSMTIKIAPNTEPGILPRPPMMIMAINIMDNHKLKGSGVMLIM